jgi:hypothetical protein
VIHGSLISKEQEICLKGALKIWKYDQKEVCFATRICPLVTDLIHGQKTIENVREALKPMGIAQSNLKDYLADLQRRCLVA